MEIDKDLSQQSCIQYTGKCHELVVCFEQQGQADNHHYEALDHLVYLDSSNDRLQKRLNKLCQVEHKSFAWEKLSHVKISIL